MSVATATPTSPAPRPSPAAHAFRTAEDWLQSIGNVPLHRVRWDPLPGTATAEDAIRLTHADGIGIELVNGTLVEKRVGLPESIVASNVIFALKAHAKATGLGVVAGEQGMIRMSKGNIRMPDIAYFLRSDLPGGRLSSEAAPRLAPVLAVEVLSPTNTEAEMRIKFDEYFASGTKLVWKLDPPTRTLKVYDAPNRFREYTADEMVDGGEWIPGLSVRVAELFEM